MRLRVEGTSYRIEDQLCKGLECVCLCVCVHARVCVCVCFLPRGVSAPVSQSHSRHPQAIWPHLAIASA